MNEVKTKSSEETSELIEEPKAHLKQLQGDLSKSPSLNRKDPEVHQVPGMYLLESDKI